MNRWAPALAALLTALSPRIALAHGGVTGTQDLAQDYGVLVFLLAVVLIGAGVVVWVLRAPPDENAAGADGADDADDADAETPARA